MRTRDGRDLVAARWYWSEKPGGVPSLLTETNNGTGWVVTPIWDELMWDPNWVEVDEVEVKDWIRTKKLEAEALNHELEAEGLSG
jgi:hypothetical protein